MKNNEKNQNGKNNFQLIINSKYLKDIYIIKELVDSKIPVMGHIGYTPQFKKKFRVEGESSNKANKLLKWKK